VPRPAFRQARATWLQYHPDPGEIVVDERGRTSLARVCTRAYDRYQVEEFPDGRRPWG